MALIATGAHRCGPLVPIAAAGFALTTTAFASFRFFSYAAPHRPLASSNQGPPSSPGLVVQHATHRASVMARSGRGPAAPRSSEPQRRRIDFLPLGFAHSSRAKKVAATASSTALRPFGCVADRPRPADRHRGRGGRGLETQNRRSDMATIGSFKKVGNDFQGEIITLSLQAKGVRIVAESNAANDKAPSHRVFVGRADHCPS